MPSFTCPRCGRTSNCPEDALHGYCGACRAFTGAPLSFGCPECGVCVLVPPDWSGPVACTCSAPRHLVFMDRLQPAAPLSARLQPAAEPGPLPPSAPDARAAACYTAENALAALAAHPDAPWQCEASSVDFGYLRDLVHAANLAVSASRELNSGLGRAAGTAEWSSADNTDSALISGEDPGYRQDEVDDCHYGDAMEWHPGDAEL